MAISRRIVATAVLLALVISLLVSACRWEGEERQSPAPATAPSIGPTAVSWPAPVPTTTPSPVSPPPTLPAATGPAQISWVGPLLYSWREGDPAIPVFDLGSGEVHELPAAEPINVVLDWSPDGCYATYLSSRNPGDGGRVHLIHLGTLRDRQILSIPPGEVTATWMALRWAPNGEWIAYSHGDPIPEGEVYLLRLGDGISQRITDNDYGDVVEGWTADGRSVLYWSFHHSAEPDAVPAAGIYELKMFDIETGQARQIARFSQPLERWDDLVITDVNTLRPAPLELPGAPGDVFYVKLYWTPDFRYWVIMTADDFMEGYAGVSLYWVDLASSRVKAIFTDLGGMGLGGIMSPDGKRMALTAVEFDAQHEGHPRTYVLDLETGETELVARELDSALWYPRWSADGTMLSWHTGGLDDASFIYHLDSAEVTRLPGIFERWYLLWSPRATYGPEACRDGE